MDTNNPFYRKTVVITGKLTSGTRDELQSRLISLGANPASSITRNTDFLIVGEKAGSKLAKARELGVRTLTEAQFEAMLVPEAQTKTVAAEIVKAMFQAREKN